jgi:hypothetical protein
VDEDMLQIGVPDPDALESDPGSGFYPVPEVIATDLTDAWEYSRGRPV